MKLDHLCDVSIERSAGGFGTLHSLTPDDGMRTGPISLHTAIRWAMLEATPIAQKDIAAAWPQAARFERVVA
jgi:hypothetical protein